MYFHNFSCLDITFYGYNIKNPEKKTNINWKKLEKKTQKKTEKNKTSFEGFFNIFLKKTEKTQPTWFKKKKKKFCPSWFICLPYVPIHAVPSHHVKFNNESSTSWVQLLSGFPSTGYYFCVFIFSLAPCILAASVELFF